METIGRKMSDFRQEPPKGLWDGIEDAMRREGKMGAAKSPPHRLSIYRRAVGSVAAMIAIALLVGGGMLWKNHQKTESARLVAQSARTAVQESVALEHGSKARGLADFQDGRWMVSNLPTGISTTVSCLKDLLTADKVAEKQSEWTEEAALAMTAEGTDLPLAKTDRASREQQHGAPQATTSAGSQGLSPHPSSTHGWDDRPFRRANRQGHVTISLMAANFMNATNQQGGYGELMLGSVLPSTSKESGGDYAALGSLVYGNEDRAVYTKTKHKQPVKLGVSVSYPLSERLSVGSGVVFSYLSSDLTSGTEENHYTTHQALKYIGLPLTLNYTFYKTKRFSFYATGGGMVEKCAAGKSTTDYVVDGHAERTQHDKVKENKLQYSLNAAAGVQAGMTDHLGFYLEPGVSYHFDNKSPVTNIYKDSPLNFSIGMGLRYSF